MRVPFLPLPSLFHGTAIRRTEVSLTIFAVSIAEDGKEMTLDTERLGIKGIVEEVDRHSRALQKQADLTE